MLQAWRQLHGAGYIQLSKLPWAMMRISWQLVNAYFIFIILTRQIPLKWYWKLIEHIDSHNSGILHTLYRSNYVLHHRILLDYLLPTFRIVFSCSITNSVALILHWTSCASIKSRDPLLCACMVPPGYSTFKYLGTSRSARESGRQVQGLFYEADQLVQWCPYSLILRLPYFFSVTEEAWRQG